MPDIIKTWPAFMSRARVLKAFGHFSEFYFTIGPRKPQQAIDHLWYTHQGEIIGSFKVDRLVQNDGSFPKLRSISGEVSEWQIKPDRWVAICKGPFSRLWPCKNCLAPMYKQPPVGWFHCVNRSSPCPGNANIDEGMAEFGGHIYHEAFRGFRYFDLQSYRGTMEAKVQL